MPQNFYELVWIFIVYAFIGWCAEVAYAALNTGKFVNRGFLNGPYCPIYGCGVVIVVGALTPLKENLFLLFAGSFLLTSVLEYITGLVLEQVFHNRWWDYTDKPFNIKGYVCLKFSVYWGLACTFIMDILHPMIYKAITMIPYTPGVMLLVVFFGVFVVDFCITVSTILKFNRRLKMMDEIAAQIHKISDEIGENIYENVMEAMEVSENFQREHAEIIEKINASADETREKWNESTETAKARINESVEQTRERWNESTETAKAKINESVEQTREKWNEKAETARARINESVEQTRERWNESTEAAKTRINESVEQTRERWNESTEAAKARINESVEQTRERWNEKAGEARKNSEEKRQRREELRQEYMEMMKYNNAGFTRLLKAFPKMKSKDNNEMLEKFRENLKK